MARDEIRRLALCADLARRQAPLSLDALRLIDRFTLALQLLEQEHGQVDLQALRRMIPRFDPRAPAVETAIGAALVAVGIELAIEDEDRTDLQEQARAEMLDRPVRWLPTDGPGDSGPVDQVATQDRARREVHQHLTRISNTPAALALAEVERERDEDLEVDLDVEWDVRDQHAGEGR